ncbi:MAG: NADH-quinone oxidoreductase subunit G, partial [Gammaproteobacteria bacterium]
CTAGSGNIDHRLRQLDFSDQDAAPVMPWLGQSIEDLEKVTAALLVGSHVRKEQPLMAHRLRKAAVHHQAKISFVNPRKFDWHFPVAHECTGSTSVMLEILAAIAKAAYEASSQSVPAHLADVVASASISDEHRQIVDELKQAERATVLLGSLANLHPQLSVIRKLAHAIAEQTGSTFGYLPEAANTNGAWIAGAVPHRGPSGQAAGVQGGTAFDMHNKPCKALITFNVEPEYDSANGARALVAARAADFVVAISSYASDNIKDYADVILPLAAFTETSGTYVNAEGFWQSFRGVTKALGESRPGWKILRVMANLLNLDGFEYVSSEEVRDELKQLCADVQLNNAVTCTQKISIRKMNGTLQRMGDVPIYATDALVRRAKALQKTKDAVHNAVRISGQQAEQSGLKGAEKVKVNQSGGHIYLPLVIDDRIPQGCVWISAAVQSSLSLGDIYGPVELEKI